MAAAAAKRTRSNLPIENLPALNEALAHAGPWLGGGVGGGITLKKPIERLLGAPIDRLLAGYEARTEASKDRIRAVEAVRTREAVQNEEEALARRALSRIASTARTEQNNIEAVVVAAIEDLRSDPPSDDAQDNEEVDDDFLAQLQRASLDASTERVQRLYGRILAGQIRQPGSFSLATLQALSTFDQATAQLYESWLTRFNSAGFMPNGRTFESGGRFDEIVRLVEAGLVNASEMMSITIRPEAGSEFITPPIFSHGSTSFRLKLQGNQPSLSIRARRLTSVGAQIRTLTQFSPSTEPSMIDEIKNSYVEASVPRVEPEVIRARLGFTINV